MYYHSPDESYILRTGHGLIKTMNNCHHQIRACRIVKLVKLNNNRKMRTKSHHRISFDLSIEQQTMMRVTISRCHQSIFFGRVRIAFVGLAMNKTMMMMMTIIMIVSINLIVRTNHPCHLLVSQNNGFHVVIRTILMI